MSEFVLHPEACSDLDEIWEYIAADNQDAADRVLEEIYSAIQSLIPFPYVGHQRPDLTARPLRFHTVREYVVVYAPGETPLAVIAVLHGRRNPRVVRHCFATEPDRLSPQLHAGRQMWEFIIGDARH